MSRNPLLVDAAIALVLAIFVLIISPGLAVVGLVGLLIVLVCAISFGLDRRRRRRRLDPVTEFRRSRRASTASSRPRRTRAPAPRERSAGSRRAPRGRPPRGR